MLPGFTCLYLPHRDNPYILSQHMPHNLVTRHAVKTSASTGVVSIAGIKGTVEDGDDIVVIQTAIF